MVRPRLRIRRAVRRRIPPTEPLFAIPFDDEGRDIRLFSSAEEADAAVTDAMIQRSLATAGSLADLGLEWEEVEAELGRIRHEHPPSPPVNLDE